MAEDRSISSTPPAAPVAGDTVLGLQGGALVQFPWSLFDPEAVREMLATQEQIVVAGAALVAEKAPIVDAKHAEVVSKHAIVVQRADETVINAANAVVQAISATGAAQQALAAQQSIVGQASLAAGYAAAAGSVVQQDLSGATAAAVHRSPNAVVAACFMDVSTDSDPRWPMRTDGLSYTQEPLNGNWLTNGRAVNGVADELHARCIGSTLGAESNADSTFSSGAINNGWACSGAGFSFSGGKLVLTGLTSNFINANTVVIGTIYKIRLVVDSVTTAFNINGGWGSILISAPGIYEFYKAATATTAPRILGTGAPAAVISEYSVKPVTVIVTKAGDYYNNATDGKCYALNAGAYVPGGALPGVTETFTGNSARPPRFGLPVAEAGRVTIYDLTRPGYPMWKVFPSFAGSAIGSGSTAGAITSVAYREGVLVVGTSNLGGVLFDFAKDRYFPARNSGIGAVVVSGRISTRAAATYFGTPNITGPDYYPIVSNAINALAMCTMPDAPVDLTTSLQVPTIAVATSGGLSIIQNDGAVRSSSLSFSFAFVSITPYSLTAGVNSNSGWWYALKPAQLGAAFAMSSIGSSASQWTGSSFLGMQMGRRDIAAKRSGTRLGLMKFNESNPLASLFADITDVSSTGWMQGGTVRCYLADTQAGVVSDQEGALNGDFATDTVWDKGTGGAAWTIGGGVASISANGFLKQPCQFPLNIGDVVRVTWTITARTTGFVYPYVGGAAYTPGGQSAVGAFSVDVPITSLVDQTIGFSTGNSPNGISIDNVSFKKLVADRSYKGKAATILGSLTKTAVAAAAQLVFWSNWSATNWVQEPYSADLDPGTGGVAVSVWGSLPTVMPTSTTNFPLGAEILLDPSFDDATKWAGAAGTNVSGGFATFATAGTAGVSVQVANRPDIAVGEAVFYSVTIDSITQGGIRLQVGGAQSAVYSVPGTYTGFLIPGVFTQAGVSVSGVGATTATVSVASFRRVLPAWAVDRSSAAAGASYRLGCTYGGNIIAEVTDSLGVVRTITTTATYSTGTPFKARLQYETSGALTLKVNGEQVAQATGAPLGSLSNATAVLTIGNSRSLNSAWPGSLALVKIGMTVPTDDAGRWMYAQELQMFQPGAQITLPDAGALVDLDYDDTLDGWRCASAANESYFSGLVRVFTTPSAAGNISKIYGRQGCKAVVRTGVNPGVDFTEPPQNLKEQLQRRTEEARRGQCASFAKDWTATFTASTTNGQAQLTGIAGLVIPDGATLQGAAVSGAGIPAGTTILSFSGATAQLSAPCTATAAGVTVTMLTYILPQGAEAANDVFANRLLQTEGATFDYTRGFNGFRESVIFPAAAPPTGRVRVNVRRAFGV